MGFFRQEYWTGLPFSSLGDLPDQGIEPTSLMSSTLAGEFFTTSATWETLRNHLFSVALRQHKDCHWGWASHLYHFSGGSDGKKKSTCNAADPGLIPGSGGPLEKEMATHSSILAWRIPWTSEPGRVQSKGLQRVGYDWAMNTFFDFLVLLNHNNVLVNKMFIH